MKKRVFAMLMAAVMAFSLVACGNKTDNGGGDAADTAETIKLGGVGPLTGGYANYVRTVRAARRGAGCQGDQRCRRRQR